MLKSPLRWLALLAALAHARAAHVPAKPPAPHVEVVGFWRFEHDVKPEPHCTAVGPATRVDGAEFFFADEVPGPFIYDPLQKISYPNTASMNFQSAENHDDALAIALDTAKAGLAGQSVTLEFFFKPDGEWNGPLVMKSRATDAAAEWGLEARYFEQQRQTYLHAFFTPPGGQTEHFRGGHFGSSAQIRGDNPAWRHMAFVFDATAKTLACYIDYYQSKVVPLPGEMKWDAGGFCIGGGPVWSQYTGRIDEVRLTKGALRPSQFLRARRDPVAGLSFESVETLLPRDCGYVDLKEAFGAVGDGRTDDTAALREAFGVLSNQAPLAHNTLYVPPGTYLISEPLVCGRSLTVQGAGSAKTILKLRDKCPGFAQATEPRALLQVDSSQAPPSTSSAANDGFAGITIANLSIDTGSGNPGAKGLETQSEYLHSLEDVQIRSGDGTGLAGLEFAAQSRGAALVKNVRIKGFDCAIVAGSAYSTTTLEQIEIEGQRVTGIKNSGQILAVRQLASTNAVPALVSTGANSMVTMLDSTLKGGARDGTAVQCEGGLYALRVVSAGYKIALRKRLLVNEKTMEWKEQAVAGPKIEEFVGDQIVTGHGTLTGALKLPIENTPEVPWGDIHKDWVGVQKFADKKAGEDWAPAIQAAIDSGARTVYFPPGRYEVLGPVRLHGKVDRLFGLHSHIAAGNGFAPGELAVIFDEPDAKRVVTLDRLEIDGLRDASPATLILKNTDPGRFENAQGCGKLFVEGLDAADVHFDQPQKVWARQWNARAQGTAPAITTHGATLWCLGFTSEAGGCALSAEAGAQTEILGAFVPPLADAATKQPLFSNANSRLSLVYGTTAEESANALQIVDTQGTDAKEIDSTKLLRSGTRLRMDLFTSDALAPPAAH